MTPPFGGVIIKTRSYKMKRFKMSRGKSKRNFRKGSKTHPKNVVVNVGRGGGRL